MPGRILIGTENRDKVKEVRYALADLDLEVTDLASFPGLPSPVEDGATLEENAQKKAFHFARLTGQVVLSDDTGLEVEALGGRPGVYSARYAGEEASYTDNCFKLLEEMEGIPEEKRKATFRTVIALVVRDRVLLQVEGACVGRISTEPAGFNGFGYDPVFFVPAQGETFAEMSLEMKNRLSHRARALAKLASGLQPILDAIDS